MNIQLKFFKDILRDKGSTKYSITKTLALVSFVFLMVYLSTYSFLLEKKIDHTLVIELLGFIAALVGLKNSWGKKDSKSNTDTRVIETKNDEGVF